MRYTLSQNTGRFNAILLGIVVLTCAAIEIFPRSRYGFASRRINENISAFRERRPENVSEKRWENCVAWASIAHCNICFSDEHAKYTSMIEFEYDLDEKLKGGVNLDALKWIGERAAKTGPRGEIYIVKVRWREQWDAMLHEGDE